MGRIAEKFAELRKRGETALVPFVIAGDPDLRTTLEILHAIAEGGADCIELGIPFSDPTADGPTIQRSAERALKSGFSLPRIFRLISEFRRSSEIPLILFGYYNPFFRYGVEKFCREAAGAGADGILCVDLPPEESDELKRWTDASGMDLIFLVSPTTGADRVRLIGRKGRGFIYYVSVTGVTGARRSFDDRLREQVALVRRATSLPVGVGFGISTPEQAAWIAGFADAAVVGSALVAIIERAQGKAQKARRAGAFVARLKRAMQQVSKAPGSTALTPGRNPRREPFPRTGNKPVP
jgi:tryptophan synthase alpha chain